MEKKRLIMNKEAVLKVQPLYIIKKKGKTFLNFIINDIK